MRLSAAEVSRENSWRRFRVALSEGGETAEWETKQTIKERLTILPRLNSLNHDPGASLGHDDILTCGQKKRSTKSRRAQTVFIISFIFCRESRSQHEKIPAEQSPEPQGQHQSLSSVCYFYVSEISFSQTSQSQIVLYLYLPFGVFFCCCLQ